MSGRDWLDGLAARLNAAVGPADVLGALRASLVAAGIEVGLWRHDGDGWTGDPGSPPADAREIVVGRLRVAIRVEDALVLEVCSGLLELSLGRLLAEERATTARRRLDTNERIGGMGSYDWEIATDTNDWSDELYRIYGHEPGAFNASYERFLGCIHPDDRETIQAIHQRAFQTHEPYEMEERIVRPDGEVRTLWSNGAVIVDDDGTPVRMVGVCRDVTEQRRAEEAAATASAAAERHREELLQMQLASRQALELNDNVVQGLATATWLLDRVAEQPGRIDEGRAVIESTLEAARRMMDDLLDRGGTLDPADLVREGPAPSTGVRGDASLTAPGGSVRIVLADDSDDLRLVLRLRLSAVADIEVVAEAANGEEAIARVLEHAPDVVILDVAMPVLDGLSAARRIRAAHPGIHIVMVSGYSDQAMEQRALAAGADRYVPKGVDFSRVVSAVLGARQAA